MKKIDSRREEASGGDSEIPKTDPLAQELDGYVDAGMKSQALRLVRRILKQTRPSAEAFSEAVIAIFILAGRVESWGLLIAAAYSGLTRAEQRSCHWLMIYFHCEIEDYEAAAHMLPATFGESCNLFELALALSIRVELDQLEEAKPLARKCAQAVAHTEDPSARTLLILGLTKYFARVRDWDQVIAIWEPLQDDAILVESALIGLVEIYAAKALLTIQSGLEKLAIRRKDFDADREIIIPGNDQHRWDGAEKKLQRHKKWIEKILPKARQKEFGFGGKSHEKI